MSTSTVLEGETGESAALSLHDQLGVSVVVEELPNDLFIESIDPVVDQQLTDFVFRNSLLVFPETPDGGFDAHKAAFELNRSGIESSPRDPNLVSKVGDALSNNLVGIDSFFIVGLCVLFGVVGQRHHRIDIVDVDIVDGNLSGRPCDGRGGKVVVSWGVLRSQRLNAIKERL